MSRTFRIPSLKRFPQRAYTTVGNVDDDPDAPTGFTSAVCAVAGRFNQEEFVYSGWRHEVAVNPDDDVDGNQVTEDYDVKECPLADAAWKGRL